MRPGLPLARLEVLVVDCQATASAPRGHLLEIGWARRGATSTAVDARLVALPAGERIPPAVVRVTGLSERSMGSAVESRLAWLALADVAARFTQQPAPTVIHFARFETPFLVRLAGGALPLDLVCTHEIARRLLPNLPRRGLRALTGYFGRAVPPLRRSADHVEATAFVWGELIRLLEAAGVSTWAALHDWLDLPIARKPARRIWPMPRDVRLAVPVGPGVYRMLRTSGDVLYVGKAASLHHRVNSYFRRQHGVPERMLEMLSQARGLSFGITPSVLEAALLESDEIKQHRPPYNVALTETDRAVWFAARDLSARDGRPSAACPLGPFASADTIDRFERLARGDRAALADGRWGPDRDTFEVGCAQLRARHGELSRHDLDARARLLCLGTRLWREGRRDRVAEEDDEAEGGVVGPWTPALVQSELERLVLRAALARRRAIWLTRMVDASVTWSEPGVAGARVLVIEQGAIATRGAIDADAPPPVPPGYRRSTLDRRELFTVAMFDRLRVLTSELRRLTAAEARVAVRFGPGRALADARLAAALGWV